MSSPSGIATRHPPSFKYYPSFNPLAKCHFLELCPYHSTGSKSFFSFCISVTCIPIATEARLQFFIPQCDTSLTDTGHPSYTRYSFLRQNKPRAYSTKGHVLLTLKQHILLRAFLSQERIPTSSLRKTLFNNPLKCESQGQCRKVGVGNSGLLSNCQPGCKQGRSPEVPRRQRARRSGARPGRWAIQKHSSLPTPTATVLS